MNIQAERSHIIEQINQINDINLIKAIKSMLTFASSKQKDDDFVIPEEHKEMVCKRIKEAKPEDYIPWDNAKLLIKKSK